MLFQIQCMWLVVSLSGCVVGYLFAVWNLFQSMAMPRLQACLFLIYFFFYPYMPVVVGGVHPCLGWRGRDVGLSYSTAFACASRLFLRQAVVLEQGTFDRLVLGELGFQEGKAGRYGRCVQVCGNSDIVSGGLPQGHACDLGIGWIFTGDSAFVDERLRSFLFGVEALAPPCHPSTSSTLGEPVGQFLQFTAVLQPWPQNQGRFGAAYTCTK